MTPVAQVQPVREAEPIDEIRRRDRPQWWRRAIAGPAGLALLLAGGGALVRVTTLAAQDQGTIHHAWLFTSAACVLAGVALLLITLPKIVLADGGDAMPAPVSDG